MSIVNMTEENKKEGHSIPNSAPHDFSHVLIELGLVMVGLAMLARVTSRWKFSSIPLYLLGGLAFGNGAWLP